MAPALPVVLRNDCHRMTRGERSSTVLASWSHLKNSQESAGVHLIKWHACLVQYEWHNTFFCTSGLKGCLEFVGSVSNYNAAGNFGHVQRLQDVSVISIPNPSNSPVGIVFVTMTEVHIVIPITVCSLHWKYYICRLHCTALELLLLVPAATKSLVSRLAPIISRSRFSLCNSGSAPRGACDVELGFQTDIRVPESTVDTITQLIVESWWALFWLQITPL